MGFIPGECLNGIHAVDFLIWRFPNRTLCVIYAHPQVIVLQYPKGEGIRYETNF